MIVAMGTGSVSALASSTADSRRLSRLLALSLWVAYLLCLSATGMGVHVGEATVRPEHVGVLLLIPLILAGGELPAQPRRIVFVGLGVWVACCALSSVFVAVIPLQSLYIVGLIIASLIAFSLTLHARVEKTLLIEVGTWVIAALSAISLVAYLVAGTAEPGQLLVTVDSDGTTKRLVGLAFEANIMGSFTALWVGLVVYYRASLTVGAKIATSIIVMASILTLTRAAWIALALTLLYALVVSWRSRAAWIAAALAIVVGGTATIAILMSSSDSGVWLDRLKTLVDLGSGTGAFRVISWGLALHDLATSGSWLIGMGTNSFRQRHVEELSTKSIDYLSNAWLAQLHDSGIIGFLGIVVALVALWIGTQRRRDALPLFATLGITAALTNPLWFAYPWVFMALLDFTPPPLDRDLRRARVYPIARVAHVERLAAFVPGDLLYTRHREDWDPQLAANTPGVARLSTRQIFSRAWRGDYDTVEVPEPLAVGLTPQLLGLVAIVRIRNLVRAHPVRLVSYAIENLDQAQKVADRTRLPKWLVQPVLRLCWAFILSGMSRVAFGTHGAMENYRACVGRGWDRITRHTRLQLFPALPAAASNIGPKAPLQACFLGGFQRHKGIAQVMTAWPLVQDALPGAQLVILGQGQDAAEVQKFAREHPSVTLHLSPARSLIRATLSASVALVLLSRRTPTFREQVGLPIVEGLEHGCEIVTTRETGIAGWLLDHGHTLVDSPESAHEVAQAIIHALTSGRTPQEIVSVLPAEDARAAADRWLFE